MSTLLTDEEIEQITELVQPAAQARRLEALGFIVLGCSARGKVRALADHPSAATPESKPKGKVRLNFK